METRELDLDTGGTAVPALLERPATAHALLVLGHGAGAGMRHEFMETLAAGLHARGIATLRYTFPYMHAGRRRVDAAPVLEQCVRDAAWLGRAQAGDLALFAGGKSLGGRMTSRAAAHPPGLDVRGIVFFGFPLHPPRRPGTERAEHLSAVQQPMLFLQGTRDDLADLALVHGVVAPLPRATLHVVEHADHGFDVLKRSGRTRAEVRAELCDVVAEWIARHAAGENVA